MSMAVAIQPVFVRNVLAVPFEMAGTLNANIQIVTEIFDLLIIGYLGHLSDRFGRVPIVTAGFLVAALGAALAPFSAEVGAALGISGVFVYYLARIVMSLGSGAVWPQLGTLAGDLTDRHDRARMLAKTAFMMAFGASLVYAVLMQIPKQSGIVPFMLFSVAVALLGAWLSKRCLVEVVTPIRDAKVPWREIIALIRQHGDMRVAFLTAFFSRSDMLFIGIFLMLWYIYFADIVSVSQEEAVADAGMLIGFSGFVMLMAIPVWGVVIDRLGRLLSLTIALAVSGGGFLLMGLMINPFSWLMVLPVMLIAIGQAGCLISPQTIVLDLTPEAIRGAALGAFNLVGGMGVVLCVQVGGVVFDAYGPFAPFMLIGMTNIAVIGYAAWIMRDRISAGWQLTGA